MNDARRLIIFGAWDMHTSGNRSLILDEAWAQSPAGKRNAGYSQSREHVRLIEEDGYTLYTFPMKHSSELRNDKARRACIAHYGARCQVCHFDFEAQYGPMGRGVIHVHHRTQLAHRDGEYEVDPIRDLIPVCPNCHAMIHLTREPLEVDALKTLIESTRLHSR